MSSTPSEKDPDRIGFWRLVAFSSLVMPIAAAEVPLTTYLPPLYSGAFGFNLALLGVVFLISRLFDGIIDPLAGVISDNSRTRFGRRKPWIALGAALFGLSAIPLFFPPEGFGFVGLSLTLFVFYIGYTLMAIPYAAWAGELSSRYHERTRITTYQTVLISVGLLLALVTPALLDALPSILKLKPDLLEGFAFLPENVRDGSFVHAPRVKLAAMGLMVFVLLLPSLFLSLYFVKEPEVPAGAVRQKISLRDSFKVLAGEKLLWRVLGSNFAVRLGQGIRTALFVFFVAFVIGKPHWAPALFLLQYIVSLAAGPIWLAIGRRVGKHRAAVAGELVQVVINLGLLFVTAGRIELLLALTVAQGLAQGSGNLMLRAIVADVADEHRLRVGADRNGLFFSVFSLSDKAALAASIGIALPLVALFGFNPQVPVQTALGLTALQAVFAIGPAVAHLASAWLIHGFPLDETRHKTIRAELDARDSLKPSEGSVPAEGNVPERKSPVAIPEPVYQGASS
ncbi:MAG: MFS transporter [Asticcacaulis sp.]